MSADIEVRNHRPPRATCVLDPVVSAINDLEVAVATGSRFIDADLYADYRAALADLRRMT
jgi:hypothetical protein